MPKRFAFCLWQLFVSFSLVITACSSGLAATPNVATIQVAITAQVMTQIAGEDSRIATRDAATLAARPTNTATLKSTATSTDTRTATPTPTPSATSTSTFTATHTPSPLPKPYHSPVPTATLTNTPELLELTEFEKQSQGKHTYLLMDTQCGRSNPNYSYDNATIEFLDSNRLTSDQRRLTWGLMFYRKGPDSWGASFFLSDNERANLTLTFLFYGVELKYQLILSDGSFGDTCTLEWHRQ